MNVVIIEDETLAAQQLQLMITEFDADLRILTVLDSVESSVQWFRTHEPPDLLLADIELVDGQSFELFSAVDIRCPVIFTTAYDEYALRAFQVHSIDYLLKPINEEALRQSLTKFQELKRVYGKTDGGADLRALVTELENLTRPPQPYRDRFLLKQGSRLFPVYVDDIAYFFTRDRLAFVRTWDNRTLSIDYNLDELEHLLNPKQFYRANRQFILSPRSVDKIHLHLNHRLKLELRPTSEEAVYISRDKGAEFRNWMGE